MLSVKNCWKIILPNRILQKQQNGQRCYFLDSENRSKALNYLVSHLHNLLITLKRNSCTLNPAWSPLPRVEEHQCSFRNLSLNVFQLVDINRKWVRPHLQNCILSILVEKKVPALGKFVRHKCILQISVLTHQVFD